MALATSSDSGILIGLGDQPSADMTARLLLALTALYVQRQSHTAEEQRQYIELALHLVGKVEAATRIAVAGILQRHPDAPAEVVTRLGGKQSSHGGDPEGEPHSALEGAFGEAFFAASPAERRGMLSLLAPGAGDDAEATPEDRGRSYGKIDTAARQGWVGEFAREFERLIDIPESLCDRILNDPSGEPMVVAAKAAGMPIAVLQRILLLVSASASYSVQRVYDLTELYHGLDGNAARDLLAQWRTQAKRNDPIAQTVPNATDPRPDAPRNASVASLRSRFGALTERLRAVNARPDRGSVSPGAVFRR